jgi:hypothetical protein
MISWLWVKLAETSRFDKASNTRDRVVLQAFFIYFPNQMSSFSGFWGFQPNCVPDCTRYVAGQAISNKSHNTSLAGLEKDHATQDREPGEPDTRLPEERKLERCPMLNFQAE